MLVLKDLSKNQLIEVIKNGDDSLTNRIVVSNDGTISLFAYENHPNNTDAFSYGYAVVNAESFQPGNDYIGVKASKDSTFIQNEYKRLNDAWHKHLETGGQTESSDFYG